MGTIVGIRQLVRARRRLSEQGKTVVFTNGTFDIIHRGHVEYLSRAKRMGDVLIVGLNTDASVRRIKGRSRPINSNRERAVVLAALTPVDYVCFFGENTPRRIIERLRPDVLVKGADWSRENIVGRQTVERYGGVVHTIRLTPNLSTTRIIERVLASHQGQEAALRRRAEKR
jgi:rfaE bifunctional protein nucleotidyltransferase chain/domain